MNPKKLCILENSKQKLHYLQRIIQKNILLKHLILLVKEFLTGNSTLVCQVMQCFMFLYGLKIV